MIPPDAPKTRVAIAEILSRGYWYTPEEVCGCLEITYEKRISGSACTARIRELKLARYGGYNKQSRPRVGCTAWEYIVLPAEQKAA